MAAPEKLRPLVRKITGLVRKTTESRDPSSTRRPSVQSVDKTGACRRSRRRKRISALFAHTGELSQVSMQRSYNTCRILLSSTKRAGPGWRAERREARLVQAVSQRFCDRYRCDDSGRTTGSGRSAFIMRQTTVLIAEDHTIVKEGLVRLLQEHGFDVVAAVGDGHLLLDAAKRHRPDVIVTDLSMPGLSGLDVLERLRAEQVDSKVVVLTMHNDADLATRAMRAGAAGFLLKDSAGEELVSAIEQALQGHVYLTPALTQGVMDRLAAPHSPKPELTTRQREVLRLLLEGRSAKEIAATLQLSPRTVESHKYEMMGVLGVDSTAQLIRYAIEHRLIVA